MKKKPGGGPWTWLISLALPMLTASCSSPPPKPPPGLSDPVYLQASAAGRTAFDQGQLEQSAAMFRQAVVRARATNWPVALTDAAYNLAVCELALQHYPAADAALSEAVYTAALAGISGQEIRLLQAKSAYLQGKWTDAIRLSEEVMSRPSDLTAARAATVLKGQALCELADVAAARAQLQAAAALSAKLPAAGPSQQADFENLRGKIARLEKNDAVAAMAFDREADLLRATHRYHDMSHALARAAESHLTANHVALAAERYFLAGRSIASQGDVEQGRKWLKASIHAAEKAQDAAARARAESFLKQMKVPDAR